MHELMELIAAGEGYDSQLDDRIASAIFGGKHRTCIKGLSDEAGGMWMYRYPNGHIGSALRFSGSVDAAMTLIPKGWGGSFHTQEDGNWAIVKLGRSHPTNAEVTVEARTLPRAICIAALKAGAI